MKKTKIIATIGPASDSEEILEKLFLAGVNVARLNFSHGDHVSHKRTIDRIKKVRDKLFLPIAIMLDTKGPEIRTGLVKDSSIELKEGDPFRLLSKEVEGDKEQVSISYKDLWKDIDLGQRILIDDGLLELEVKNIEEGVIETLALNDGLVGSRKGVNVPGAQIKLPALTDKDLEDIIFGIEEEVDFIAASFIRKAEDVLAIREVLENNDGREIKIIAKIENKEGVDNMDSIIDLADGIMVARGDLGVEIETEKVPFVQKKLIARTVQEGIPVITATQMLDSMIRNPRPTRAEVTDVANAILDGTSAIMLSGETASGKYPVEAVEMMSKIAVSTESSLNYEKILEDSKDAFDISTTNVIARNTCEMARELSAKAIVIATATGYSSRAVAKFRPETMIIGVTPNPKALRQMSLHWGIKGILGPGPTEDVVVDTVETAKKAGAIVDGDLVIIIAGIPQGKTGSTNLIKVHQVAKVAAKGMGIGKGVIVGKARVVRQNFDFTRDFNRGDIIVAQSYWPEMASFLERSGGFIVEEEGLTSSAAIAGIALGVPTIVGVKGALDIIEHNKFITMDAATGEIYIGHVDAK